MSLKTVIVNQGCHAECVHCPHGQERSILRTKATEEIAHAHEDIILLSGGEPLELTYRELLPLIRLCVENKKIFRIATGGHVPLPPFVERLRHIPYFSGFSVGTDVLLSERNSHSVRFQRTWEDNVAHLQSLDINFSFTVSLSQGFRLASILPILARWTPDFYMLNSIDKAGTEEMEQSKAQITAMGYEVVYGYIA